MSRTVLVAPFAIALILLAGCQSEEEKRAEQEKLKSELKSSIKNELAYDIQAEVDRQLKQAIADHKKNLAEQAAAAKAPVKGATTPPAKPTAPGKKSH